MNLTKLNRRIVRETDVVVDGVPIIISLEPGGHVGLKIKGTRQTMFASIADLFTHMSRRMTVKEHTKPKAMEVKVPSAFEAAVQLIKESKGPVHIKTLEKLVSGEVTPENLKKMLKVLQNEHVLEHVAPFHIQAVKEQHHLSTV